MRNSRPTSSRTRPARRGFALLLTLMTLMVVALIVAQVAARVSIESQRVEVRVRERQCRRALDSTVGIAVRLLTESLEGLRVDHLGEEWTRAKTFQIGDARLDISIIDCERLYDLKGLLEEEAEALDANKEQFAAFAAHCGLEEAVARRLADSIAAEAEVRRQEDATWAEATGDETATEASPTTTGTTGATGTAGTPGTTAATAGTTTTEESRPIWLEEYLSLPQLSDEDRKAIVAASFVRQDAETGAETSVRLADLLTIWRYDKVNVNTASREVLMYSLPNMAEQEDAIDDLIAQRDEEPLLNTSQIKSLTNLDNDQANQVVTQCRLTSRRFRVTATADLVTKKGLPQVRQGRMTLILERTGNNEFKILWRSTNL